eukprot:COSAG06_NODE_4136_length_4535_cov_7.572813_2_plen_62_part_00
MCPFVQRHVGNYSVKELIVAILGAPSAVRRSLSDTLRFISGTFRAHSLSSFVLDSFLGLMF